MYEGCLEMIKTFTLLRKKNKSLKLNLIFFFQVKHKNFEVSDVIRSILLSLQTRTSLHVQCVKNKNKSWLRSFLQEDKIIFIAR